MIEIAKKSIKGYEPRSSHSIRPRAAEDGETTAGTASVTTVAFPIHPRRWALRDAGAPDVELLAGRRDDEGFPVQRLDRDVFDAAARRGPELGWRRQFDDREPAARDSPIGPTGVDATARELLGFTSLREDRTNEEYGSRTGRVTVRSDEPGNGRSLPAPAR